MANALTSNLNTVESGVVTCPVRYPKASVFVYVDYTKGNGTNITITAGAVNGKVHATNKYEFCKWETATIAPITLTFDTTGKYRFEVPVHPATTSFSVTLAFSGGTTAVAVVDIVPN